MVVRSPNPADGPTARVRLVRVPDYDPDTELEGYLEAEWGDEDAEPSLYLLLEQSTGKHLFPEGVTIGQIEDFLTSEASPAS